MFNRLLSEHRGAGEGDVERSEAAGSSHFSRGLSDPQTEEPRRQVSKHNRDILLFSSVTFMQCFNHGVHLRGQDGQTQGQPTNGFLLPSERKIKILTFLTMFTRDIEIFILFILENVCSISGLCFVICCKAFALISIQRDYPSDWGLWPG